MHPMTVFISLLVTQTFTVVANGDIGTSVSGKIIHTQNTNE